MGWRPRRARGTPLLLLLLLLLLWPVPSAGVLQGHIPGQPVTPHWVLDGQPWRAVSLEEPVSKPDMGLVALEAEGQELLLELEKNHRLLAPGYIETHYSPDGQPVVLAPNHTDHCHYQGRVRGFPDSWVVLCTCSGMSGLITLSRNASYYLRPWPPRGSKDFSTHKIFRMEQLLTWKGACGHRDPGNKAGMTSLPGGPQSRDRREARRTRKYLELYIVADHTLFLTRHRNLNHTKQRLLEVANYVDQLLRTLDIQVVLAGLEVWTERDRSRRQLRAFFRKGGGACLSNAPDPGLPVPPALCGNGFVEAGEECDCGSGQECRDLCCFAHNCSLRPGAQCAHGDCCVHCLLKPAGALCRQAMGDCDLPEFCTGTSSHCPPDVYLLDGSPCARGSGYCWDGACPTLEQQCQQLWGPGSHPAPEACFQVVNSAGDAHGNCGQDSEGHFLPCAGRDALCGKLQCQGGKPSLLAPHMVPVDSTVHLEGHEVTCRGALALPSAQLDLLGLGLVEPGTQCGPRMVCQSRRCRKNAFQELQRCLTACHSHGVCNSNHNCHCAPGWAPPFCDKPGFGGSMDSGPVQAENHDTFLLAMLLSVLLPLLPGAGLAWCCYRLPGAHLQRCSWGCRRDPACSGPKDGPHRDHPLGGVHPMELGPTATGQPWPLDPENSHEPSSHPEKPLPAVSPDPQDQAQMPRSCLW
ncbi:ADAM33 isoform 5 [Pan troglodytes]|uniref:ADAM33 isoform 5 n=1 Tax=Pan troglodytes TaxID=9598 RepID=A0A2J8MSB8_PANTR|nr:ADAM33 isoform 5 [Pan troglodytes]